MASATCSEMILPLGGIHIEPMHIARASALLNLFALAPWAEDCDVDWEIRRWATYEVLQGSFGRDLRFLCNPVAAFEKDQSKTWLALPFPWSRLTPVGNTDWFEVYRDKRIEVRELFLRVPESETWASFDRPAEVLGPSRVSKSLWCDGLLNQCRTDSSAR